MDFIISNTWWEPGTVGFDIGDATAVLVFIITFYTVARGFSRWWMRQLRSVIKEEIGEATAPIHPSANGGLSLPDVARKVNEIEGTLTQIKADNLELKDLLVTHIIKKETAKVKKTKSNKSA